MIDAKTTQWYEGLLPAFLPLRCSKATMKLRSLPICETTKDAEDENKIQHQQLQHDHHIRASPDHAREMCPAHRDAVQGLEVEADPIRQQGDGETQSKT